MSSPSYELLGRRVCIIGRSCSGKSTLAVKLAAKMGCDVLHLDQIAHIEGTDWVRREDAAFSADHDRAILGESWVIEGNYSKLMPQRLARATYVLWLDMSFAGFMMRYVGRCLKKNSERAGMLKDATHEWSWSLVRYVLFHYPRNRPQYQSLIKTSAVPLYRITSMRELNQLYKNWGLKR